jgi:hypothetical protein
MYGGYDIIISCHAANSSKCQEILSTAGFVLGQDEYQLHQLNKTADVLLVCS